MTVTIFDPGRDASGIQALFSRELAVARACKQEPLEPRPSPG